MLHTIVIERASPEAEIDETMKVIRKPNRFYYLFNLLIAHTHSSSQKRQTHRIGAMFSSAHRVVDDADMRSKG